MPASLSINSLHTFCLPLIVFKINFFSKYSFRNAIRVSNSLDFDHAHGFVRPGPEVIKLFSCSTQLSTKFQLFMETKILTNEDEFIMLINVKMPTIVGI